MLIFLSILAFVLLDNTCADPPPQGLPSIVTKAVGRSLSLGKPTKGGPQMYRALTTVSSIGFLS